MTEPTMQDIIHGFRAMPGTIEERAAVLASWLSRGNWTGAVVERIEGSIAYIQRMTMINDFEGWRLRGYMGSPYREIAERIRIEMDPCVPLEVEWEEI